MLNRYYWKMNAKMAKVALVEIGKEREIIKAAQALAKKCGGTGQVGMCRDLGVLSVYCFGFKHPPDEKLWKKAKGSDGYIPRRCRANKDLWRAINDLRGTALRDIEHLVVPKSAELLGYDNGVLRWRSIGVRVKGKDVYVDAPAEWKLKDCKRISDVEYEKAVGTKWDAS